MGSPAQPLSDLPRALTIAGSDSGGGAGIQADLKVFFALRCHGMSALTALTAQNTVGVNAIHEVPEDFVAQQIAAVTSDIGVDAVKTGMLASAAITRSVAKAIQEHHLRNVVVDPVFVSKHGDSLLTDDAVDALRYELIPLATVVTPNLPEASALVARQVRSVTEMKDAAQEIAALGPRSVLIKGGHLEGPDAVDVYFDTDGPVEITAPRYDTTDTHGTGCVLSAAICAYLARGEEPRSAVTAGKDFVTGAIRRSLRLGAGYGPVNPGWATTLS